MANFNKQPRKGQNPPQFVIHGKRRKAIKRELWRLRNALKTYWAVEDLHNIYGSDGEGEKGFDELSEKIKELEEKLSERVQ